MSVFQREMCGRTNWTGQRYCLWRSDWQNQWVGIEEEFPIYKYFYSSEFLIKNKLMQYLEKINIKKKRQNWSTELT